MITKIVLRNFKRFKKQIFEIDSNIVFAGQNNSGKTTVIQAIAAWRFALLEWLESGRKERGFGITRQEFSPVPLREFKQLWSDTSTGFKKDEVHGKSQGTPRPLTIEIHGGLREDKWQLAMEFKYNGKNQIYVGPTVHVDKIPTGAKELEVAYIPSFSGIGTEEHEITRKYQDTLIGQGKPGDILRNLLQEVGGNVGDWQKLCGHIKDIFEYELLPPSPRGAKSFIVCEYRPIGGGHRPSLDINTAGSGFQQVLMLLAFLYARPASVLLIDEPDAHLHINLQGEILRLLKKISQERGGQLIVATHSEVVIDSTAPESIISFVGEHPRRLSDTHDRSKLKEAMARLRSTDLLKCEQSGNRVLCLEGQSDFNILREWANTIEHPVRKWFNASESYWYDMRGRQPRDAQKHFIALQAVAPEMRAFVLVDSDGRPGETGGFDANMRGIVLHRWPRYEIENYLVHPDAIRRLLEEQERNNYGLFGPSADKALKELEGIMPPQYFQDPLADPSGYLMNVKGSEHILPRLFDAAGCSVSKSDYVILAEVMIPKEIHPDVREILDAIASHFGITK